MKAILLNRILLVLAFVGVFIAGVLVLEAHLNLEVPCGAAGGCAKVAAHSSSRLLGIPVADLGLVGYLLLAGLAIARSIQGVHKSRQLAMFGLVASGIGVLFSVYLQYVSLMVIGATCLWCLSSALLMIVTFILHAVLGQNLESGELLPDANVRPDFKLFAILPTLAVIGIVAMGASMKAGPVMPKFDPKQFADVKFVPDKPHLYGDPNARVTIVEFADILCPACQRKSPEVKEFVSQHPGIRIVYRHYPLAQLHPQAMTAAAISEVASEDGKFWDFVLSVMGQKLEPKDADELLTVAGQVGIDVNKVRDRLGNANDPVYDRVAADLLVVKQLGLTSTPTFFILVDGKVQGEPAGPGQIMDRLNDPALLSQTVAKNG